MQIAGLSALDFLRCTSHFEFIVMQAITQKAIRIMEDRDEALAVRIANAVAKALGA